MENENEMPSTGEAMQTKYERFAKRTQCRRPTSAILKNKSIDNNKGEFISLIRCSLDAEFRWNFHSLRIAADIKCWWKNMALLKANQWNWMCWWCMARRHSVVSSCSENERNFVWKTCCKRNDEKLNESWFSVERLISKSIAPLEIQCVLTYDKPKLKHKLKWNSE